MSEATPAATPPIRNARRNWLLGLGTLVLLGGLAWGVYWFLDSRNYETTDDSYVGGDVVQITSDVPGTVIALHADDTQRVERDQALLELDPADAKVAMASAEAGLAQAVRRVRALFAQAEQLRSRITEREAVLKMAQDDYNRRARLVRGGGVSAEEFAHSQDSLTEDTAALASARAELDQTMASIGGTTVADHPDVRAAAAKLRDAALGLHRTRVTSPVAGVIARRGVQLGQRVDAGTPLMAVVPLDDVWIDANFKEVQLRNLRVGQKVTVRSDLYGGDVTYPGRVAGLAAGSGNAFALLPPQNATGNWIKIVQRVPVRILLDPEAIKAHPLRVGLSTTVAVDVRDRSGPPVGSQLRNQPLPSKPSDADDPSVDALIDKIVAENGGSASLASTAVPPG
jgi:membrane fusion protein (multidrug efflux system)